LRLRSWKCRNRWNRFNRVTMSQLRKPLSACSSLKELRKSFSLKRSRWRSKKLSIEGSLKSSRRHSRTRRGSLKAKRRLKNKLKK